MHASHFTVKQVHGSAIHLQQIVVSEELDGPDVVPGADELIHLELELVTAFLQGPTHEETFGDPKNRRTVRWQHSPVGNQDGGCKERSGYVLCKESDGIERGRHRNGPVDWDATVTGLEADNATESRWADDGAAGLGTESQRT